MVGGQAAGDEMKAVIVEGQGFGIGRFRGEIGETAFLSQSGRFGQHFGGDVAGDDLGDVGGKSERRMARAGSHVEDVPIGLGLGQFDKSVETSALGMDAAGGIIGRSPAK